ncbi:putative methanol oxidase [Auricularia subglabra TFB-10046 SS5]|nr:putative methanol oxidase [Auricularia subglabra TFB-10046 SS5]
MADLPTPEVDIIVVGAGAAGSVLTARLAAAAPELKILVLEQGPHTLNDPAVLQPARFTENLLPGMPRTRYFTSEPSADLLGRTTTVQAGGCVGGGTAINFMMYTRPAASDYDDWERLYDNPGWGFESLRPLFQKLETWELETDDKSIHGFSGPMRASRGSQMSEMGRQWLASALAWDKGRPDEAKDINDFRTADAYGTWHKWIGSDGVRQDAGHRFLYPAVQAPGSNVTLRVQCRVNRLVFENNRAIGVEYFDPGADNAPSTKVVTARKLVVLSAGAFGSPMILERSGIGAPAILGPAGIKARVPLEQVGENYQDHNIMAAMYRVENGSTDDRDAYLTGDPKVLERVTQQYKDGGKGLLGTNGIDVGAKLRPTEAGIKALGEAFGKEWHYFADAPDKAAIELAAISGALAPGVPPGDYLTSCAFTMYPAARGTVHIRSADPAEPPRFVPGYLANQVDVALLMWQYKVTREIVRRMPCYRGELAAAHPAFAASSAAVCSDAANPVPVDEPDLVYSPADDAALETWVRQTVATTWHAMGTCAMKPRAKGGVVDSRLNVYGVEGLKVADLSIGPANVSANTAATALVIGEKAAILIGEDLGITNI